MNCSIPGFPVHHQLPEFAQTHVHRVGDAIQPYHPLSPYSVPAFNFSQHQGLFQWVSSSQEVAKAVLPMSIETDFLYDWLVWSTCFSSRTKASILQRSTFFIVQFSHPNISSAQFSSVAQSCPTLWPQELQHTRPPCPSQSPRVYPKSHPSRQWCHPAFWSSVVLFSSYPQSFPALESFPGSQMFTWGGQILEFQLQHQSFQWTLRNDLL